MIKKVFLLITFLLVAFFQSFPQETFPVNGIHDEREGSYAFINATIVQDYEITLTDASLVIRKGIIEAVGKNIKIPAEAVVIDLKGKHIYPSFIDIYTSYGIPNIKSVKKGSHTSQSSSSIKGAYGWNEAIHSDFNTYEVFRVNNAKAKELRNIGFGTVLSLKKDGIARGSSVLVTLANHKENKVIVKNKAAAHYSFNKGSSAQDYPGSLMGSIALLRQTYLDAKWYKQNTAKKEYNISLESWNSLQALPQIFEVDDKLSALRADKIGDEFGVQYIIKGSGNEYQRIEYIKAMRASFIIPVNFPAAYDVEDPYDALQISLGKMKHWEMAPANLAYLEKNNIIFSITTSDLKDKKDFWKNLSKAVQYGLSKKAVLKALTITPAKLLGVEDKLGSIEKGKTANFLITSSDLFNKDNIIYQNWVQGSPYIINDFVIEDLRGTYELTVETLSPFKLKGTGKLNKPKFKIETDDTADVNVVFSRMDNAITLTFELKNAAGLDIVRLSGWIENGNQKWKGKGQLSDGRWVNWTAIKVEPYISEKNKTGNQKSIEHGEVSYPFLSYGWKETPKQETILFKNATVWTNEKEGVIKETDVLIKAGKIIQIGQNINYKGANIVNAKEKHLTSGVIDEHSHLAIVGGVNECTQSVTSEVRIGDVVNSEDINIYRQLAGGVTVSHLLHGSCNSIGGQTALIKMRWGFTPEKMKFEGTAPFIKFALGENVKESNRGNGISTRFPQTRMGVEQIIYDGFIRAREYGKEKAKNPFYRKDLELEALLEVLNKKRFITCHSYVQSEVNMLMKVADSMGFTINTFTHILEGYKVADKMKEHGAGASTFSDWWAYKYEVIDAIPYNAALMTDVGVITALNSDDAEMGRRLNQEAAKAIKYGGLSEENAWKLITLNPAKLLRIDDKVGSIKAGKDADLVLWSDNPLSIYAKAEKTYVDGICFYDMEQDTLIRIQIKNERQRLIKKMYKAKKNGEKTQKPKIEKEKIYRCNTIEP